jgi:ssDNA-binding Zn-finger/Zn-ribbon topoisomerase 1
LIHESDLTAHPNCSSQCDVEQRPWAKVTSGDRCKVRQAGLAELERKRAVAPVARRRAMSVDSDDVSMDGDESIKTICVNFHTRREEEAKKQEEEKKRKEQEEAIIKTVTRAVTIGSRHFTPSTASGLRHDEKVVLDDLIDILRTDNLEFRVEGEATQYIDCKWICNQLRVALAEAREQAKDKIVAARRARAAELKAVPMQ